MFSIFLPGILIYFGLRVLGERRSILKCSLANITAFTLAFIAIFFVLFIFPLHFFAPAVAFFIYLYALKSLLDISLLEAFVATAIAFFVLILISVLLLVLFGVWFFFSSPQFRNFFDYKHKF